MLHVMEENSNEPPDNIDGAKVIEWAWSGKLPFGYIGSGSNETATAVYGLALCQYEKENEIYRFSCDANWETEQDGLYSSVEEAKELLPDQYREQPINWTTKLKP